MRKTAKYDSPAWLLVPGHRLFFGANPNLSKFPRLAKDDDTNTTLWGTIGATLSAGTLAALLTSLSNRSSEKKMNEIRKKIRDNKIRSLMATSVPKGVYEEDEEELNKEASGIVSSAAKTLVPMTAAITTAALVHNAVADKDNKKLESKLDTEIAAQRAKLESLYARLLKLYGSGSNFQLSKSASAEDVSMFGEQLPAGFALALLGGGFAIPALAAYYYTKKHSDNRAAEKVLKEQLLASNLTNIPDSVLLQLDPHIKNRDAR